MAMTKEFVRLLENHAQLSTEEEFISKLPFISDVHELMEMQREVSSPRLRKRIEERIEGILLEILPSISDLWRLVRIWRKTLSRSCSKAQELVERRIEEILPEVIPSISDLRKLDQMWKEALPDSTALQLISKRIRELIAASDLSRLNEIREELAQTPSYSKVQELIEERIRKEVQLSE